MMFGSGQLVATGLGGMQLVDTIKNEIQLCILGHEYSVTPSLASLAKSGIEDPPRRGLLLGPRTFLLLSSHSQVARHLLFWISRRPFSGVGQSDALF